MMDRRSVGDRDSEAERGGKVNLTHPVAIAMVQHIASIHQQSVRPAGNNIDKDSRVCGCH